MPLQLVRADITKIQVDAVVNATNRHLMPGGRGVDYSIHRAAGPMLLARLNRLEPCEMGHVVVTESFQMDNCKLIIHAVPPVYYNGQLGEQALLESCYREILAAAMEADCGSIAVPILGAGANGYPKAEAYAVAVKIFREFFAKVSSDLEVYLVLFTDEMLEISRRHEEEYDFPAETDCCVFDTADYKGAPCLPCEEEESPAADGDDFRYLRRAPIEQRMATGAVPSKAPAKRASRAKAAPEFNAPPMPKAVPAPVDYHALDLSFAEMCIWWYTLKGIPVGEFYSRANISRATFSNMKNNPDRTPKINTAAACAIALKLSREETDDLLARAGLVLTHHHPVDRVVMQCIANKNYDIDDINMKLFDLDLSLLGSQLT